MATIEAIRIENGRPTMYVLMPDGSRHTERYLKIGEDEKYNCQRCQDTGRLEIVMIEGEKREVVIYDYCATCGRRAVKGGED